jgi:phosphoenolpyruvate carboxylase
MRATATATPDDEIATLVASWSLEQAEQVARAFAVYFHLANLAEEHQRIRNLRERDTGTEPVRESLAAAVAEIGHDAGPEHLRELLASLRVHLVLTAHPTEARRRAVVAALRRISGLLDMLDDRRAAAADHAEARRELREQIDLLWRTSQLRVKAMDPIDEVRTVMTAFDETLFRSSLPCTGSWTAPWPRPPARGRRRRPSCASAAGWVPTGTATRS